MKLQFKLALYNTLTKLAIIVFTGLLILFSLENITYNHISARLKDKKNELMKHLSSKEISQILNQQQTFTDYNILKEEYIFLKPIPYRSSRQTDESISTARRTIEQTTDTYLILTYKFNFNNHSYLLEIGDTMDAMLQLKQTIKEFTLLMLFVALSLTLVIDLVFTKYLLTPFYQIIDRKLIRVNDPMNFDYKKIKTTTQDFELLDNSISALMNKIADLFILEKQFIANVSHELLTPISIISTRLENVLVQEQLTEDSENKIFASLKTLNRLKSIINSLLLISRVENLQFNKTDTVDLKQIITEVYNELEDRLEDKKIIFTNNINHAYILQGNQSLLHTLFFNLVNNAIKYNHVDGSITITDEMYTEQYILQINDTGMGMDDEEIELAFNRFEKFDRQEKESYGLGLAIVKSITAFHNIRITIQSAKNKGTTVKLIFSKEAV
ncbi:signal transduction histidine kinase [Mucilaginibacter frigoritolerans]|uniref:histidine kinase n=1 Tax=Mucilaginibacter frigoritolerans TaxID=652788 RepID=A0A562TKY4_9SPHI|nr:HAMP domain-containing sensor histidine kinase [Mucilaginibacter frigoritolerans]TWI94211.1 signal transduction histidine kinase [Mucilaginibacter frigoritolerans]